MTLSAKTLVQTKRTVESYEGFARDYNALCTNDPPPDVEVALRRMLEAAGPAPYVLEIGSGPGRDADFIETQGARVRRTDATQAFLDLQAERGKYGELLNVITDDLGGPYDAALALCVLIHVGRNETLPVLRKIAGALRPGGIFLVSMRDGDGETGGDYHTVYWRRDPFLAELKAAGFVVEWDEHAIDSADDHWLRFLARRP
jgi:SAM-dependent methyltransferase